MLSHPWSHPRVQVIAFHVYKWCLMCTSDRSSYASVMWVPVWCLSGSCFCGVSVLSPRCLGDVVVMSRICFRFCHGGVPQMFRWCLGPQWCVSDVLVMLFVMSRICFVCVSWMFWSYLGDVSVLLWWCVKMFSACVGDVLVIFKWCVGDVSGVSRGCLGDAWWFCCGVFVICGWCLGDVLAMMLWCVGDEHPWTFSSVGF